MPRPSHDSLASGGSSQSLPRFASTAPPAAKADITLDSHGKLQFGKGLPEALTTLLQQTIGKNSQPFVAHHENQEAQQHALVDKSGRLFVIQSDENQHIALHSSGRSAMPTGKSSAGSVKLESTPEHLSPANKSGGIHQRAAIWPHEP
nr:AvrE-family type 3 secretion system effector [Pectobacterium colocasium]